MSNADAAPSPGPDDQPAAGGGAAGNADPVPPRDRVESHDSAEAHEPAAGVDAGQGHTAERDGATRSVLTEDHTGYDPDGGLHWDAGSGWDADAAWQADSRWDGAAGEVDSAAPDYPEEGGYPEETDFEWVEPHQAGTEQPPIEMGLFGGDGEPESRPRRHIGRYVALAGAALVIGAGVVTGPSLWRVYSARHTSLTLPATVAGLSRDTAGDSQDTADYLRDAVSSSTSLSHPLGAVYDVDGNTAQSVLVFGGTGAIFRPDHTLGTVLDLLDDSSDAIKDLHTVPAGPLGGTMKCGISVGSGNGAEDPLDPDMPICGWADHGSSVAGIFPGRTVAQAADLMLQFRAAIEKR
jgi:hypothetical protein